MKSKISRTWMFLLFLFLFAVTSVATFGIEVGAMFNVGNLVFKPTRLSSDTSFAGTYYPWGVSLFGSEQVSDNLSVSTGLYNDTVLRNIVYSTITYQGNYFSVGAGPLLGFFNSAVTPLNPGITASVKVQIPGVIFLSYRGDSSLGSSLVQAGDYVQKRSDISFGYYVPNAIVSLNILSRAYTEKTSAGDTIDQLIEYSLKTDIYQKNVPYRILLTFGYQTLSKTFVEGTTTTIDQLGSLIVGTRLEFHMFDFLTFVTDLKSSVYTFGQQALVGVSNPGPGGYLFQLQTGAQISLGSLLNPSKK